ncbi:MAG: zeta toxin family protein [Sphingomonadales bacterium]|nr:zeta toxin family protein [Sphingomonadales bacterium]
MTAPVDRTAALFTDRDVRTLDQMAVTNAAARACRCRRQVRLPTTRWRKPSPAFRDKRFHDRWRALAVNPELSALGILQRFVAQKDSRGYGRMKGMGAHRAALGRMLDTLDRMQDERLADRLTIYRRGGGSTIAPIFPTPS